MPFVLDNVIANRQPATAGYARLRAAAQHATATNARTAKRMRAVPVTALAVRPER